MADDIPQWAFRRACELRVLEPADCDITAERLAEKAARNPKGYASVVAFARYIAEHEEPPVDPFTECIKIILGGFEGERHARQYADSLRAEMAKRGLKIVEAP